jgi:hypothetical protein
MLKTMLAERMLTEAYSRMLKRVTVYGILLQKVRFVDFVIISWQSLPIFTNCSSALCEKDVFFLAVIVLGQKL